MKLLNASRLVVLCCALIISLLAFASSTLIVLSGEAAAQDDQSTVYTIEKTQKDIETVDRQITAEFQTQPQQLNAATAYTQQLNNLIADYNRKLAFWNGSCLGTPAEPGDMCSREQQAIIAELNTINAARGISNQMTAGLVSSDARIKELTQYRDELLERLHKLKAAKFGNEDECLGLTGDSGEALKHHCGNVQFDHAKSDLGPCTDEACRSFDELRR